LNEYTRLLLQDAGVPGNMSSVKNLLFHAVHSYFRTIDPSDWWPFGPVTRPPGCLQDNSPTNQLAVIPGFEHYVSVVVAVAVAVTVPFCVCTGRSCLCCWGLCAVIAGRPRRAELQAHSLAYERQIRRNRTRSYMNGWTATANLQKWRTLFFT